MSLATNYEMVGKSDSSQLCIEKAKSLVNKDDLALKAHYYSYLGQHFFDISNYVDCVPNLTQAINILKNLNASEQLADAYFLLGDAYSEAQNQPRSIYLYKLALALYEQTAKDKVINTKNTLGWSYFNLHQADSAYHYIKSALKDYEIFAPNSAWRAYPIGNLGLIYELMDSNSLAISYSLQAIEMFEILGYTPGIAEAHNNLGKFYFKLNDLENSKKYFNEAHHIAADIWFEPYELMNAKIGLSLLAEKENQPILSLQYLREATNIKDSLFNQKLATQLLADEMYRSQQEAENRLDKLEHEKLENAVALRKSQYALIAITLTLLIVIGSSIAISISWRQRQSAIKKQTEILSINQEIIRMISHDFRGPMNNIRTLMELIRDENMTIQEFNEVPEIIYKQTCDISLMFETFVGWALSQSNNYSPKTEKTDWDENVAGVISLLNPLAAIKNIDINYKKDQDYFVETDRIAAQLVLRNIISNAIKYSFENSTIEVNVSSLNNLLVTEIVDFGIGIDAIRLKELFNDEIDSQEGTKNEIGSGLGLKMAMKFAYLNGGRIEIKSEVGEGSKFTYYLPLE